MIIKANKKENMIICLHFHPYILPKTLEERKLK